MRKINEVNITSLYRKIIGEDIAKKRQKIQKMKFLKWG